MCCADDWGEIVLRKSKYNTRPKYQPLFACYRGENDQFARALVMDSLIRAIDSYIRKTFIGDLHSPINHFQTFFKCI